MSIRISVRVNELLTPIKKVQELRKDETLSHTVRVLLREALEAYNLEAVEQEEPQQ